MAQGNWTAARQSLFKIVHKDTLNVEAEILLSRWFFSNRNPNGNIDSAYKYCQAAIASFRMLAPKQKEKLKPTDSVVIVLLQVKIDSAAFDRAKQVNTEKAYNDFLSGYPLTSHRVVATELRDESAFLEVLRKNSFQSFQEYIQRYPKSHRAKEAKTRYERLLFETRTGDRKLKSYESFVKDYPKSPFRFESERNIFAVLTANGASANFKKFIHDHPANSFTSFARDILFHVSRENEERFPEEFLTDSLKNVLSLNRLPWVPVYKNGKYGFIDSEGKETLPLRFESVEENYKCGSVTEDILMTSEGLVSRSGRNLSGLKFFKDLGYGFLKLTDSCGARVMHKSGRMVLNDCWQDVAVLDGRFLLMKKDDLTGIGTLSGRILLAPQFNTVELVGEVFVLDRMGKKSLCTTAQLASVVDGNPLTETFVFDEVKSVGNGMIQVRNGSLEGIVNSNLHYEIPLAIQQLVFTPFGLVRKVNDQFVFSAFPELSQTSWDKYSHYHQWLRLRSSSGEKLFDTHSKKIIEHQPDSLWFENGLAFARLRDSIHIHINTTNRLSIAKDAKVFFIKSPDSIRYFFIEQKNKKIVFNIASGTKLFATDYDYLESLDLEYFLVTRKNKKGLLSQSGKIILPAEYDALILNHGLLSLYKDKKFGLLDLVRKGMIKPTFEKNIMSMDSSTLIAYQNGYYGLIDWQAKPLTGFEFEEIQRWNKDMIWVKKDFEWVLFDFRKQRKILTRIKSFQVIKNAADEMVALVKQDNFFGVVSSSRGIIIAPSFSFVMNLGTEEEPVYFTSKEVEEAGIVVVIYYDKNGKLLRKQVYEDEEYSRIVCPQD
ncbi:hypothetical protein WSM22_02750 [Cytophagales bacterium WSM2-2]|nr:hypothetical protein WSM22_02750 [Cytophagales bacterium WSM2-2]